MPVEKPICNGLVERIGQDNSIITHKIFIGRDEKIIQKKIDLSGHEEGLKEVAALLTDAEIGVIKKPDEMEVVGHRVVHGGEAFATTTIITKEVKQNIRLLFPLAPLHNPANYLGIEVAEKIFTNAKQVAVFDTAFHQTLPQIAFTYAILKSFYSDHHIRAYGFHGTSHKYVSGKAIEYLNRRETKIITIHLGNGCSMAAIKNGKSIDTSMGFSPLSGLVMGTRSGDIDPSFIFHLIDQLGYEPEQVNSLLNKRSGMLGLTGFSDMRDIDKDAQEGNEDAALALEIYAYRIRKYIGSYAAVLNGLDAIVFTAGVGENDINTRQRVCKEMQFLGIHLDEEKNRRPSTETREINSDISPVKILVVSTNEELEIAKQCYELLQK
jgi:acetate kinase